MRLVRFGGAMSLDGYIAGTNGEYDWIVQDPERDFAAWMAQFDTFLIGRKTSDAWVRVKQEKPTKGIEYVVFSRTLAAEGYPLVRVERDSVAAGSGGPDSFEADDAAGVRENGDGAGGVRGCAVMRCDPRRIRLPGLREQR
jgi:hypothetical protein